MSESTPYPNLWLISQHRTEAILRHRLAELSGRIEFRATAETLSQRANSVQIRLSTGERVSAKYVVGCDGGHSAVRKSMGLRLEGELLGKTPSLVADLEISQLDRTAWHIWPLTRHGVVALCPLPEPRMFQMVASRLPKSPVEEIIERVSKCKVERVVWRSSYIAARKVASRFRVARVFLAGDAAHIQPPSGGQGLNTGVQDAYNLGWKLAAVLRGSPETLLHTYEEERLPVATQVTELSTRLFKTPLTKRTSATNQLSLHYRKSSLSSGTTFNDLHPGDRMPNMRLRDGTKLFQHLRGPHATEVITPLHTHILVRPDGYIASIGSDRTIHWFGQTIHTVHL